MKCPNCGYADTKVIDSRPTDDASSVKRRRSCSQCNTRFTTYEKYLPSPITVIKRNGNREAYDREKLRSGILRACGKRPVTIQHIDDMINTVEKQVNNQFVKEISAEQLGTTILALLKDIDEVSYIRFASVYRKYEDIENFVEELSKLQAEKRNRR